MKKIIKISIITVVVIVCAIALLVGGIYMTAKPTHGDKIQQYGNPQQALLVIDVQEDFTGPTAKPQFAYKNPEKIINSVNAIIEKASKKNINIIYVRQEFDGLWGKTISVLTSGGNAIKGNPGTEIDKRISILSKNIFPKPMPDAFSNPNLEAFLIEHQVNTLYLTGLDAEFCVHFTAWGALDRGYKVYIITDSVALRNEKKWDELLQQYRDEGITLISSQQFME
jgi:nicotinamidase-related amidase